jgi:hypothetical protein
MTRALIVLHDNADRAKARRWADGIPLGSRIEFKAPKRTLPQNDRFWAMLTDIAQQKTYHGLKLTTEDYKLLFLDALKREVRIVPNLDGSGFVNLSKSSSDLSKSEMSDLMEIVTEWGVRNGVTFTDPGAPPSTPGNTSAGQPQRSADASLEGVR